MNKRAAGTIFCVISSFLFAVRYVAAAIYMSNLSTWSDELFSSGLEYVGTPLLTLSGISLVVGIIYLVWQEIEERK